MLVILSSELYLAFWFPKPCPDPATHAVEAAPGRVKDHASSLFADEITRSQLKSGVSIASHERLPTAPFRQLLNPRSLFLPFVFQTPVSPSSSTVLSKVGDAQDLDRQSTIGALTLAPRLRSLRQRLSMEGNKTIRSAQSMQDGEIPQSSLISRAVLRESLLHTVSRASLLCPNSFVDSYRVSVSTAMLFKSITCQSLVLALKSEIIQWQAVT